MINRGSGFIKVLRMSFNLFVPFCLTGTNRGLFYQQTALCHEYIAGTERDLYLKLTRSSLFPNNYSAGKRDRGKRHPREEGGEAPRLHRTGGEAPCSMKGRKTRREENVFKGVENLPALLYTIV